MVYSKIALEFIENYPHANIISNTRIDKLQNFFKKHNYKSWKSKPIKIKETACTSYPSVNMNAELVSNLSQIARLVNEYQKVIDIIKYKIIFLAKKSKCFEVINSIYGIGEFTTSIIIAELGDINRFNNIKELTAYCVLDPSIKQSGKSIDIHGPISKSGNKYIRKILCIACSNIITIIGRTKQENDIEIYYRKKRNEGKASIIACTTKLLRKILALCKQLDN
ncbi:MAG: IS110 family transposase [Bacilli bacterium]|nr:IS110 family transposase [Bacilli bacterium]